VSGNDREDHVQAVGFAGMQVEEFQGILAAAADKAEEVLGIISNAVGEQPSTESGRNALGLFVHIKDTLLPEISVACEAIKEDLNSYGRGQ
jgi:hypothetical protein